MNKKHIKLILSFLIMFFCIGINEVMAEETIKGDYMFGDGSTLRVTIDNDGNATIISNINTGDTLFGLASGLNEEIKTYYNTYNALPTTLYLEKKSRVVTTNIHGATVPAFEYVATVSINNITKKDNYDNRNAFGHEMVSYEYSTSNDVIIQDGSSTAPPDHSYIGGNCEELLSKEIVDFLKEIFNIFKIIVPIIIVGFGVLDFSKAVFSGDDAQMKKAQGKFVKRLIYGIIFFFIPMIVMLIIELLNQGWGTCGIN